MKFVAATRIFLFVPAAVVLDNVHVRHNDAIASDTAHLLQWFLGTVQRIARCRNRSFASAKHITHEMNTIDKHCHYRELSSVFVYSMWLEKMPNFIRKLACYTTFLSTGSTLFSCEALGHPALNISRVVAFGDSFLDNGSFDCI